MAAINLLTNSKIEQVWLDELNKPGTETLVLVPFEHAFYIHQNLTNGSAPISSGEISVSNCKLISSKNTESEFLLTIGFAVQRGDKMFVHPFADELYAENTGLFRANKSDKRKKEDAFIEFLINRILQTLYQRNDVIAKSLSENIYPQKQLTDEMRAINTATAKLAKFIRA